MTSPSPEAIEAPSDVEDTAMCGHGTRESEGWCAQCEVFGEKTIPTEPPSDAVERPSVESMLLTDESAEAREWAKAVIAWGGGKFSATILARLLTAYSASRQPAASNEARREAIERSAAHHEQCPGNPALRKLEADRIRALADKG